MATGETGKIYVALDTNLTYRWSGSAYVEISPSLALGETSSTAYRGDRGASAYAHISRTDNPHSVTKAQVGLGNVGNFKAVSTVASQGLTDTEKQNARDNIGFDAAVEEVADVEVNTDTKPYIYRALPYNATRALTKIVGASVGWNQLVPTALIHIQTTISEDVTTTKWGDLIGKIQGVTLGHKFLALCRPKDSKCVPFWGNNTRSFVTGQVLDSGQTA